MIGYLAGKILSKQERTLILIVNESTGYVVHTTRSLIEKAREEDELALYIHTHVREDDISLFGFQTAEEWLFFKLLLTVSGVGPKSALEILNAPIGRMRQAIAKKDIGGLTQIPGIGRKTAERIVVDLQGKIKEELLEETADSSQSPQEDIVEALISLGYQRQRVVEGLKKIPKEVSGEESIIKYFLQNI